MLGMPQQTSVAYGLGFVSGAGRSLSLFPALHLLWQQQWVGEVCCCLTLLCCVKT
jgi:hypothetical protein